MGRRCRQPWGPKTPTKSDAWSTLSRLLRGKPLTEREAAARLRRAGFAADETAAAVRRAVDEELLDDRLFAKLWVDDRLLHHPLSRRAVEVELVEKGVARELIAGALDAAYPSSKETELAHELAAGRWARLAGCEPDVRRRRVMDHLLRRGFPAGLAGDAVRRVEREEDA